MTEALISHIEAFAAHAHLWGFLLVFVFMTIESSFIPFPSEVVMFPAGFLAARGVLTTGNPLLDAVLAVLAGTAGSLLGAAINYYLAWRLGAPFLERHGKYFFLPPPKLHRAQQIFLQYGPGATFVCRLLPAIRQLISIPAGLARMPLGSFFLWTGLGAGIWVTILTVIGYQLGRRTAEMSYADIVHAGTDAVRANLAWVVIASVATFVGYVLISRRIMAVPREQARS